MWGVNYANMIRIWLGWHTAAPTTNLNLRVMEWKTKFPRASYQEQQPPPSPRPSQHPSRWTSPSRWKVAQSALHKILLLSPKIPRTRRAFHPNNTRFKAMLPLAALLGWLKHIIHLLQNFYWQAYRWSVPTDVPRNPYETSTLPQH